MCSSSFCFYVYVNIHDFFMYDIFLVWFDFSIFGCVHNLLQAFVKIAEQDTALTLGKK